MHKNVNAVALVAPPAPPVADCRKLLQIHLRYLQWGMNNMGCPEYEKATVCLLVVLQHCVFDELCEDGIFVVTPMHLSTNKAQQVDKTHFRSITGTLKSD